MYRVRIWWRTLDHGAVVFYTATGFYFLAIVGSLIWVAISE